MPIQDVIQTYSDPIHKNLAPPLSEMLVQLPLVQVCVLFSHASPLSFLAHYCAPLPLPSLLLIGRSSTRGKLVFVLNYHLHFYVNNIIIIIILLFINLIIILLIVNIGTHKI